MALSNESVVYLYHIYTGSHNFAVPAWVGGVLVWLTLYHNLKEVGPGFRQVIYVCTYSRYVCIMGDFTGSPTESDVCE